jgi:hypothetical protein
LIVKAVGRELVHFGCFCLFVTEVSRARAAIGHFASPSEPETPTVQRIAYAVRIE